MEAKVIFHFFKEIVGLDLQIFLGIRRFKKMFNRIFLKDFECG